MSETEKFIIQLAESCEDPDDFVSKLEKIYEERGVDKLIFDSVGHLLYNQSYYDFALSSWNYALGYYIQQKRDIKGVSVLYRNLGKAHHGLGDFRKVPSALPPPKK